MDDKNQGSIARWLAELKSYKRCLAPTNHWTIEQKLWILKQTVVSVILCFGINFGITTLTFRGGPDPTMWKFPQPMAGLYTFFVLNEQ